MKTVIYDFANNPVEVELPDNHITEIHVQVLTGDEIVTFVFADGTIKHEDSSNSRIIGFDDGEYFVSGEDIQKWLDYKPSNNRVASYERQGMF